MKQKKEEKKKTESRAKKAAISHLRWYKEAITRWDKGFAMSVIFDFAYLITVFGLFILSLFILKAILLPVAGALQAMIGILGTMPATGELGLPVQEALTEKAETILWFYGKLAIFILGGAAVFLGITSIYKAFIWMHLKNLPLRKKYIFSFVCKNMTWQALWLALAIFIFLAFSVKFAAAFLMLELVAYLYFTPFFRAVLTEKHKMKEIYKETFIVGCKKSRHFIVPIIMMGITLMFSLWFFIILLKLIAPAAIMFVGIVTLFVAVSWSRFYFYIVTQKIHQLSV